jgi:hypothetical protein
MLYSRCPCAESEVEMNDTERWLLEVRLFKLRQGTREEFDRISREGTIPLMRRLGITVVTHGPSVQNDNGYVLIRAFPSEQERVERSQALYATDEWLEQYDAVIPPMIEEYDTAVLPMAHTAIRQLAEAA